MVTFTVNNAQLLVSIQQLILLLLVQRLHVVPQALPHRVPVLLGALLLDLAFVREEHLKSQIFSFTVSVVIKFRYLNEMLRRDGPGKQWLLLDNAAVDGPGHVLQEDLLVLGLHIRALDLSISP